MEAFSARWVLAGGVNRTLRLKKGKREENSGELSPTSDARLL